MKLLELLQALALRFSRHRPIKPDPSYALLVRINNLTHLHVPIELVPALTDMEGGRLDHVFNAGGSRVEVILVREGRVYV